ncbi:MAG: Transcriptional regulator, MucR family [uncultured bacterium]|nr:MAG: Transcriptional regulator, MucR family [uncultured bacterium]
MTTLSELTVQVITARLAKKEMTLEELQKEMVAISTMLKDIDAGTVSEPVTDAPVEATKPLTLKQAFKKDEVICMICGKGGFKTLKKHLTVAHSLKPGQYRKQFGIPSTQALVAKSYSESRRKSANERGLGDVLAKARATRAANKAVVPEVKAKAPVKAAKAKAPVVKVKAAVPAKVAKKAALAIAAIKKMSN